MKEDEKENLFETFKSIVESIIEDKRRSPKNLRALNSFSGNFNIGLEVEKDFYFWLNINGENGVYKVTRGRGEKPGLELMATPEDLVFYSNRTNSTFHMIMKKNRFGKRKLKIKKGGRHLRMLLKVSKILVLDELPLRG